VRSSGSEPRSFDPDQLQQLPLRRSQRLGLLHRPILFSSLQFQDHEPSQPAFLYRFTGLPHVLFSLSDRSPVSAAEGRYRRSVDWPRGQGPRRFPLIWRARRKLQGSQMQAKRCSCGRGRSAPMCRTRAEVRQAGARRFPQADNFRAQLGITGKAVASYYVWPRLVFATLARAKSHVKQQAIQALTVRI